MLMTKKKLILFFTVFILIMLLAYSFYSYSQIRVANKHANKFTLDLISIVSEQAAFDMKEITDFYWDKMLVFAPYTTREEMERAVGQKWTTNSYLGYYTVQQTMFGKHPLNDDSLNKVIFIHGDRIVLDATLNRGQVDFTQLKQVIKREEARFMIEGKVLREAKP